MTLEKTRTYAQCEANRQQRSMTIWNLNRYSPMYVVRDASNGDEKKDQYIATIRPQTANRAADDVTCWDVNGDPTNRCTVGELFRADDGIDPSERGQIVAALRDHGEYRGGGGASAEYVLRTIAPTA